MKAKILANLVFVLAIVGPVLPLPAQNAREIMARSIDAQDTDSAAVEMTMELIDKNGSVSRRRLQTLTREDDRGLTSSITVFLEPASVKNTRFLVVENEDRDDDRWIYLPSLRRVRRIAASEGGSSFMGSDFTYDDMSSRSVDNDTHLLLREESFDGRDCYVIESVPVDPHASSRKKSISWIDTENYIVLKEEIYEDDSGQCTRMLVSENIEDIDGILTSMRMTMTSLASGHRTVITLTRVKYGINLNPDYFTTNFLNTGKVRS